MSLIASDFFEPKYEEGSEHQVKITAESDNVIVDDANIHDRYTITIPEIEPSGELPDHSVKIKITNKIENEKIRGRGC
jgi:hypothetical protein